MWRFTNSDTVENVDDPRDFMFVRHPISIVRHRPCGRYETIEAGFASVEAAKKWLAKLVESGSDDIKTKSYWR